MQINFLSIKTVHKIRHSLKFLFIPFLFFFTLGLDKQPTGPTGRPTQQPVRVVVLDDLVNMKLWLLQEFQRDGIWQSPHSSSLAFQNAINSQYTQSIINDRLKNTEEAQEYLTLLGGLNSYPYIKGLSFRKNAKLYYKLLSKTLRYMTDQSFRNACASIKDKSHGTHVAGLIIQYLSPEQITIAPVSYLANFKEAIVEILDDHHAQAIDSLDPLQKYALTQEKIYTKTKQAISNALKEDVKVVNMSIIVPPYYLSSNYHTFIKSHDRIEVTDMAKSLAEIEVKLWQEIIHEHPDTVFVLSAGNEQINLNDSSSQLHPEGILSRTKANNLIVVGALDRDGKPRKRSNYGSEFVNVLALGEDVPSLNICGGPIRMSGTSMAAPLVTNKITQIRYEHPNLTAKDVIEKFFAEYTQIVTNLKEQVKDGRCLRIDKLFSFQETPQNISLLYNILYNSGQSKKITKENPHPISQSAR